MRNFTAVQNKRWLWRSCFQCFIFFNRIILRFLSQELEKRLSKPRKAVTEKIIQQKKFVTRRVLEYSSYQESTVLFIFMHSHKLREYKTISTFFLDFTGVRTSNNRGSTVNDAVKSLPMVLTTLASVFNFGENSTRLPSSTTLILVKQEFM